LCRKGFEDPFLHFLYGVITVKRIVLSVITALFCSAAASKTNSYFEPTTAPIAVKQEKAQGLLRLWNYAAPDLTMMFRINTDEDIEHLIRAYKFLNEKASESTGTLAPTVEPFLVALIAKKQMLDSLNFSEERLRHFFQINPKRYSCAPTAKVAEFTVPRSYVSDLKSSAILSEIGNRLSTEDFAKLAYEITGRFGKPETGLLGDVTAAQVGHERFLLYKQVYQKKGVAGPFELSTGYLFVKVYNLIEPEDDCFGSIKEAITRDYGREWLKKITTDTVTTITRSLKPLITEVTTVPRTSETAFVVRGKATNFGNAKAMLPHVFGNEKSPEFWKSIQRQALEMELIYQSEIGIQIRQSDELEQMAKLQILIGQAQIEIDGRLSEVPTTATLENWFYNNHGRFIETESLSYTLYTCTGSDNALLSCAAALEKLVEKAPPGETSDTMTVEQHNLEQWKTQSREIQAATQELASDQWSKVFSIDGKPARIFLKSIQRHPPEFQERQNEILAAWEVDMRMKFWRNLVGLEQQSRVSNLK